ncbi:MAG: cytochrome P450 [Acidimicrobiales bacterium]|jgi:cytochrome P450|nr:cytochrome P450 [Acidimicrobiales bacterium]
MTTAEKDPIADWATDFDHTHADYAAAAPEIWDELRERCPVAHTERFGGAWLPTRHADVVAIAHDTEHFSSEGVIVSPFKPEGIAPRGYAPPITSDPPFHAGARRLLLPAFAPKVIARWEDATRAACRELLDEMDARPGDVVDAAVDYAQHIPVRVIAEMLGVPRSDGDKFRGFIHRIMETPGDGLEGLTYEDTLDYYLHRVVDDHRANPRDDLVGYLLDAEMDGEPLTDDHVTGTIALLLIAGIDTTWSAIGASLFHLATNPDDRRRLLAEPDLLPTAVEEFLRFYSPVTMARIAATDVEVGGAHIPERDWVLLSFPSANRDPEAFEDADRFVIDRERNRHVAFGVGIHRCAGSNLARLELTVALEEWLARVPDFELDDPDEVSWSTGQVRGPRRLPVRVAPTTEAV